MALDTKLVQLLDDFANTQPALRIPTEPFGSSNPKLGTALQTELAAVQQAADAAQTAADGAETAAYTAGNSAHWDGDPATIKAALDRLAAQVFVLGTSTIIP